MFTLISLIILCSISTLFFLYVRLTKKPLFGMLAKIVPSLCFVAMGGIGLVAKLNRTPSSAALVFIGLAAGVVGDILIDMKRVQCEFENEYLLAGMAAFAFGHLWYLSAAVLLAIDFGIAQVWLPIIVALAAAIIVSPIIMIVATKFMKANFANFFNVSLAYAALLVFLTVFMLWLAVLDSRFLMLSLGMAAFLLSDLVLSTQFFVAGKKEDKVLTVVNHVLYYGAQIMIASFILLL